MTGFGTDHAGEAEISVWQAQRGLHAGGHYVAAIVLANVLIGFVSAPGRTIEALRQPGGKGSLFDIERPYEELLAMTVGELRVLLGIPMRGLATRTRGLHAHAPTSTGMAPKKVDGVVL